MKTYSIGEVAEKFRLPISTIRYYDKEGLLPSLERKSGQRRFSERDLDMLRVIDCLKKSGLEIKDIKIFMQWSTEGPSSYGRRLELFQKQEEKVKEEITELEKALAMIRLKQWYYTRALELGSEDGIFDGPIPEEVKKLYELTIQP